MNNKPDKYSPIHPNGAEITGGNAIAGEVEVAGGKIASVPIVAASILTDKPVTLINLPAIKDIEVLLHLITLMGGEVVVDGAETHISTAALDPHVPLPKNIVASVHSTVYLLPVLLARFGYARLPKTYGGCQIGQRPLSHIIQVMEQMGASVNETKDELIVKATRLQGATIPAPVTETWDKYRSGITKTALLLGVRATGTTRILGAFQRPVIGALSSFLRLLGATVVGDGSTEITVEAGPLRGGTYAVDGDYLEALTYISLVAACQGALTIRGFRPAHCRPEIKLWQEMGVHVEVGEAIARVACGSRLAPLRCSTSLIDTDIQPLFAVAATLANGKSMIEETVWENRFGYASELNRMGARTHVTDKTLVIEGVQALTGCALRGADTRGAAALLVAASAAAGRSTLSGLGHLSRGYDDLIGKFKRLGVRIAPLDALPTIK